MRRRALPRSSDAALAAGRPAVDSLRRGLEILRGIPPGESVLTVADAAQRIGAPRATTRRLMHTLAAHGFLRELATEDAFEPDVACLVVGHAAITSIGALGAAAPAMTALAERFKLDVLLAVRDRLDMLVLEHCRSAAVRRAELAVGALVPIEMTALGRACLWAQSPALQGELIRRVRVESLDKGARSIPGIYRAFQELEQHGFCTALGEWRRDVHAAAAPVILNGDRTVYALGVEAFGPGARREVLRDELGSALLEAAAAIREAAAVPRSRGERGDP
jgi:DNA-binding IclR family transcriptional regulator